MKYLLFEGSSNVGKTNAIIRFANNLVSNYGYACVDGEIPRTDKSKDFKSVLEKQSDKNGRKRIVVISDSDTIKIMDESKSFFDYNTPCDVLISSCREEHYLYSYFFKLFAISSDDKVFEIPMAKINHRNKKLKREGMKWFKEKIDVLAETLFLQL